MKNNLQGKVALVTGASSGIGAATASRLAEAGMKVGIAARRVERLQGLKEKIEKNGGEAFIIQMDVANRESVNEGVHDLIRKYGSLDILVNNAGIMPLSNIDELKTDEWERMIDVNIKGVLNVTAAVLPQMIKQNAGHIFNTSSVAGRKVLGQGFVVYSATKFAVAAFSEGLRMELGVKHNIRVTSIQPGATQTELPGQTTSAGYLEILSHFPQMPHLQAIDIANTIFFAASAPEHVNVAELYVLPTKQV